MFILKIQPDVTRNRPRSLGKNFTMTKRPLEPFLGSSGVNFSGPVEEDNTVGTHVIIWVLTSRFTRYFGMYSWFPTLKFTVYISI